MTSFGWALVWLLLSGVFFVAAVELATDSPGWELETTK